MHIPHMVGNITLLRALVVGLRFGGVAIAGMITPRWFVTGLVFDGRSIVISTAELFGGRWS